MVDTPVSWTWTVVERLMITPRNRSRIIVIGEHVGSTPTSGESAVIRHGQHVVPAIVECVMRFQRRDQDKLAAYTWALSLRDVALEDVPVGAIVTAVSA